MNKFCLYFLKCFIRKMEKCKEMYSGDICNNMFPTSCHICKKIMLNKKKCGDCDEDNDNYISCYGYYRVYENGTSKVYNVGSYYETVYCMDCSQKNIKECKITGYKYCIECVKECKVCKTMKCPECVMECEKCYEYVCEVCCIEEGECVECIFPKFVSKMKKKINRMEEEIKELQLEVKYQPNGIGYQEAKEHFDSYINTKSAFKK